MGVVVLAGSLAALVLALALGLVLASGCGAAGTMAMGGADGTAPEEELEAVGFVDPGSLGCSNGGIPEPGTGVGVVVSLPVASSLSLLLLLDDDDDEASPAKMFCVGCVILRWL